MKLDRGNYELLLFLGETSFNEGDPDNALGYFTRVLEEKPDQFEAWSSPASSGTSAATSRAPRRCSRRAVAEYPDAFLPHFSLGAIYAAHGELSKAVAYLERALDIDPVPQALYLLGNCHYEMGRASKAIRACRRRCGSTPPSRRPTTCSASPASTGTGTARRSRPSARRSGSTPAGCATRTWCSSSRAAPSRCRARGRGGRGGGARRGAARAGDPSGALAIYQGALAEAPENPALWMSYALACLSLDRHEEIETAARRVLELEPGEMLRATASAALIAALRGEGKYREGNRIGRALLDDGASNFAQTIAYYEMAYNLAEMEEDLDQALDYARRSLELAPDELKQFPLAALGWVHYKRASSTQAVECLSRSNELGPSPTTLTHLGMALLASGDEEQARSAFGKARRLEPRVGALEEKMMEFLRDSTRLLERVRRRQKR